MSFWVVTLTAIAVIGLIVWWFWLSKPRATRVAGQTIIEIRVKDGTYQPAAIEVAAGQALNLKFVREDATPCAEKVVFADLGITTDLPLNQAKTVLIPGLTPGEHEFTCQMGMYRGRLIAKP
jgi:plastocyanin domain-containing protein